MSSAQSTVGTLFFREDTQDGYLLMAPSGSSQTWLMDNCGRSVNRWDSDAPPSLSAYLLEDGSLLRSARIPNLYNAGGSGGRLDRYAWDGLKSWTYTYSSDTGHQHHDIEPMPNGNILVLAWEKHSAAEAIARGRKSETVDTELWSEKIVELRPVGIDQAEIVWTWRLWDHLIQDQDPLKPNYGNPADHPGRVDINYRLESGPLEDWTHANSIDYREDLDQILISVRNFHEVWILDHSTSSAEAATSSGGNSGRGGEILYRWGNAQAYGRGSADDQVFYEQHDANWVPDGYPGAGNITVFNNGKERPGSSYSSIEEITPPLNGSGLYDLSLDQAYAPENSNWTYVADPPLSLSSKNLSGTQRQPNGNTLICSGANGRILEVNPDGELTWEYICPVNPGGPVAQGGLPVNNQVFKMNRYPPDFPGLIGRDLSPGLTIQFETPQPECIPLTLYQEDPPASAFPEFSPLPNPFSNRVWIAGQRTANLELLIYRADGSLQHREQGNGQGWMLNTAAWANGFYTAQIRRSDGAYLQQFTLIKSSP